MTVVDLAHLRRQPGLHVDAVGDVADRHAILAAIRDRATSTSRARHWPCSDETALARRDVLSASTVMQNSSPSSLRIDRGRDAISSSWRGPATSRSGPRCSSIERGEKRSWPAGTGVCVGEHDLRRHAAQRLPRRRCLRLTMRWRTSSSAANALWPSFRCSDARRDAHRAERPHAADAEQQLLADADALVAAVEPRGQLAIFRAGCRRRSNRGSSSVFRPTDSCQTRADDRARCACRWRR